MLSDRLATALGGGDEDDGDVADAIEGLSLDAAGPQQPASMCACQPYVDDASLAVLLPYDKHTPLAASSWETACVDRWEELQEPFHNANERLQMAAAGISMNSLSSKRTRCKRATTCSMRCWAAMTTMRLPASRLLRRQRLSPLLLPKLLQSASLPIPWPLQRWVSIIRDHMVLLTSEHAGTLHRPQHRRLARRSEWCRVLRS